MDGLNAHQSGDKLIMAKQCKYIVNDVVDIMEDDISREDYTDSFA